jgi:non-ribosomal peptide synthetase component F
MMDVADAVQRLRKPWATLTLPGLVQTAMRARPERVLLADAPDMENWGTRAPRQANSVDLAREAETIARQLLALGLKPGDVVLTAVPNQIEGVAAMLGCMQAGLLPCPLPIIADEDVMADAAEATGAKAILTVTRFADLRPAETARAAAARFFGVRFVCAYGADTPDGVVPMHGWEPTDIWTGTLPVVQPESPALLTLDMDDGRPVAYMRTHAQLVAEALALAATAGLGFGSTVLATFAPVSAAGVVATVTAPILTGASVLLHGPFSSDVLNAQLGSAERTHVVLPLSIEGALRQFLKERLTDAIVINRLPRFGSSHYSWGLRRTVDVTAIGEAALVIRSRLSGQTPGRMPKAYRHPAVDMTRPNEPLVAMAVDGDGRLALHGFGVASQVDRQQSARDALTLRYAAVAEGADHIRFSDLPEATTPPGPAVSLNAA